MKANSESLRVKNRALILAALRDAGPVAHTDIARLSGLSSSTVSAITTEMIGESVLEKTEKAAVGGRGRPRVMIGPNAAYAYVAAVRVTAERIEYSLVDYRGTLQDRFETKREPAMRSVPAFVDAFRGGLRRLVERSGLPPRALRVVSVTTRGLVARDGPVLLWSPVFEHQRIDFGSILPDGFAARVSLTNETRYAAQAVAAGEAALGSGTRRVAVLSLDHGIGLGVATIGPDHDVESFAPPFGHMVHQPDGPLCRCGSRGCIEAYSGYYGILRTAFGVPGDTIPAKFVPLEEVDKIAERARGGDRMCEYAFRLAGEAIGIGISRLYSFLGIMPLTIAGSGIRFLDLMRNGIESNAITNLQSRFEIRPEIRIEADEANLIYSGNVQASLRELDLTLGAQRRYWGGEA